MKVSRFAALCCCAVSLIGLGGCSGLGIATGIGATAGIASAQEGGLSRAGRDFLIQAEINDLWFRYSVEAFRKLDMTVTNGRVLLTGVVQDPEQRVEAVRLAWQPKGVVQVINEITVAESSGITGFARDSWISTRLRTSLVFDKDVQSVNYSIDTVNQIVYLMGHSQSQFELNRVLETARTTSDVKRVVSYVKMVGEDNDVGSAAQSGSLPGAVTSSASGANPVSGASVSYTTDDQGRVSWDNTTGVQGVAKDSSGAPVSLYPEPIGYPNVPGREPVMITAPVDDTTATSAGVPSAVQSEDLLSSDRL